MKVDHKTRANRPLGRPRRLTLPQIVQVAKEIGLENLTMTAVAKRLGVNGTVLYGYIATRDDLVRLVAAQLVQEDIQATDTGQPWFAFVAEAAIALHKTLTGPGKLLAHLLTGGLGAEVEIDRTEAWLEKMTASGFTVSEALMVHRQMGEIVIGAAVILLQVRALDQAGHPFEQAALKVLDTRAGQVPLLASEKAIFAARAPVWQRSIVQFLERVAADRGETIDSRLIEDIFAAAGD